MALAGYAAFSGHPAGAAAALGGAALAAGARRLTNQAATDAGGILTTQGHDAITDLLNTLAQRAGRPLPGQMPLAGAAGAAGGLMAR